MMAAVRRLVSVVTVCAKCGRRHARWLVYGVPMCDECAGVPDEL